MPEGSQKRTRARCRAARFRYWQPDTTRSPPCRALGRRHGKFRRETKYRAAYRRRCRQPLRRGSARTTCGKILPADGESSLQSRRSPGLPDRAQFRRAAQKQRRSRQPRKAGRWRLTHIAPKPSGRTNSWQKTLQTHAAPRSHTMQSSQGQWTRSLFANCAPQAIVVFGWSAGISLSFLPSAKVISRGTATSSLHFGAPTSCAGLSLAKEKSTKIVGSKISIFSSFAFTGFLKGNVKCSVRTESV